MTFSKKAILLSGILLCISVQLGAQVRQTREEYIKVRERLAKRQPKAAKISPIKLTNISNIVRFLN